MSIQSADDERTRSDVLETLLAAHVQHELEALGTARLSALLDARVAAVFQWFETVTCNEVFSPEQIAGILERNVIELKVSGGITELAGEMSRAVFASKLSAQTLVEEIFPPSTYDEFADKVMAMDAVRSELIRYVTQSPGFGKLIGRVLARALIDVISTTRLARLLRELAPATTLPDELFAGAEERAEETISRWIEKQAFALLRESEKHLLEALDPELLRDIADEVWTSVATKPLDEAASAFTAQEDFVVLGYEYWLKFRKTPYFRNVAREVIDRLFAKYGGEPLASLIADMGVTEAMISHELQAAFAPMIEHAVRSGFLEQQIRSWLEPFYRSAAARALVGR